MGDADHTRSIMKQLGKIDFWRIAMRPGRPMAFGCLQALQDPTGPQRSTLLFGLPGNPVAAMVTFMVLVRPALLSLMGHAPSERPLMKAQSTSVLRKRPGRSEFQRGILHRNEQGRLSVRTTGQQGSGLLNSMVQANCLIVLHHHQDQVAVGDEVDVMVFEGAM
jgi:molybdopterin molybdotransferase